MIGPKWTYQPSGLGLRQDEFSIQASLQKDRRFYLRRDRREPWVFTDLNFGDVSDNELPELLMEFISMSGGLQSPTVTVTDIARLDDEKEVVAARYDRIVAAFQNAVGIVGFDVQDVKLDKSKRRFNVIFQLSVRASD